MTVEYGAFMIGDFDDKKLSPFIPIHEFLELIDAIKKWATDSNSSKYCTYIISNGSIHCAGLNETSLMSNMKISALELIFSDFKVHVSYDRQIVIDHLETLRHWIDHTPNNCILWHIAPDGVNVSSINVTKVQTND